MSSQAELGMKALKEGRIAEAIVFLEFAAKFNPENHKIWLMLARAYQKDGQAGKAVETYKFVLENAQDKQLTGFAKDGLGAIGDRQARAALATVATLNCPECGLAIPETRQDQPWCACGWGQKVQGPVATRIYLNDVMAYCRRRSARVGILFKGDVIVISATEVRIQGIGTRTYPVNARLLFPNVNGLLCLEKNDLGKVLAKVDEEAMFRERGTGDDATIGKLYSWPQFLARLSDFRGYDVGAQDPDFSLAGVLAAYNALDLELISDARELREAGETLGQTILRLGISNFEAMVSAVVGDFRLVKPAARPFHERIGAIMVARGAITPAQLQEALRLQASSKRPLGEIIVSQLQACALGDVQAALKAQKGFGVTLPEADMLGELLVARKKVTRTDMLQALADEQSKQRVPLGEVLINMGLLNTEDLQAVLAWQSQKKKLVQQGGMRLGEVLLRQKVITAAILGEALKLQVVDQRPLGQILLSMGVCSPEQVLAALENQVDKINAAASSAGDEIAGPALGGTAGASRRGAPTTPLRSPPAGASSASRRRPPPKVKSAQRRSPWMPLAILLVIALLGAGAGFKLVLEPRMHAGAAAPR